VACGSDDDGGGGGGGDATCEGEVTGTSAGGFTSCVAAINHFPEGSDGSPEYWIYTLTAAPEAGAELDEPLESLGINLHLAGEPATGGYSLDDAQADTLAFVYAPFPTTYEQPTAIELTVDSMEWVSELDLGGDPMISYWPSGSFEMTLAGEGGSVTVIASF
jgi:hypothetical protein